MRRQAVDCELCDACAPLHRLLVEGRDVDVQPRRHEVVDEHGVVELFHTTSRCRSRLDRVADHFADAELAGMLRAVLEPRQSDGPHRPMGHGHSTAHGDPSRTREPTLESGLLFAHLEPLGESLLSRRGAGRARPVACGHSGDPDGLGMLVSHHSPASAGMNNRRLESAIRKVAAVSDCQLQAGR